MPSDAPQRCNWKPNGGSGQRGELEGSGFRWHQRASLTPLQAASNCRWRRRRPELPLLTNRWVLPTSATALCRANVQSQISQAVIIGRRCKQSVLFQCVSHLDSNMLWSSEDNTFSKRSAWSWRHSRVERIKSLFIVAPGLCSSWPGMYLKFLSHCLLWGGLTSWDPDCYGHESRLHSRYCRFCSSQECSDDLFLFRFKRKRERFSFRVNWSCHLHATRDVSLCGYILKSEHRTIFESFFKA